MTAPTLKTPATPTPADDWSDLDDLSLTPTGRTAAQMGQPAPDQYARTDVASGLSLGRRASTIENRNQVAMFKCDKCRGTGHWISRMGFSSGPCHKCKGSGKLKTDPETLAKRKQARLKQAETLRGLYITNHIAEYTWATVNMQKFDFARSMLEAIKQHGSWTDGQLAAIRKCMARDDERAKARAERKPDATVAGGGLDRMLKAFATAAESGLRSPKFRVGEWTFKPAKTGSQNAGCLYVTHEGVYMGRITPAGALFVSRDAGVEDRTRIEEICADPFAAAVLHGQQTGRCSCCGLELTNEESVRLGIGPICRGKWGL